MNPLLEGESPFVGCRFQGVGCIVDGVEDLALDVGVAPEVRERLGQDFISHNVFIYEF